MCLFGGPPSIKVIHDYWLSCLQLPLKQYHHSPFSLTWISEFELQPQLWRWSQSPSWMLQVFPSGWKKIHHCYPPPPHPLTDAVHLLSNSLKDPVSYRCRVILQTFLLWSHLQQIHVKESWFGTFPSHLHLPRYRTHIGSLLSATAWGKVYPSHWHDDKNDYDDDDDEDDDAVADDDDDDHLVRTVDPVSTLMFTSLHRELAGTNMCWPVFVPHITGIL